MLGLGNNISKQDASMAVAIDPAGPAKSLALDGSGDFATFTATSFDITGEGINTSIVFWAKRTDNNDIAVVFGNSGSFATKRLNFGADGTTLEIEGDTNGQHASGTVTADTAWHHYAVTIEGKNNSNESTVVMYEDGESVEVDNTNFGVALSAFTIDQIGAPVGSGSNTHEFKGILHQVAIFSDLLIAAEIVSIYNQGISRNINQNHGEYLSSSRLIHNWKFIDTSDTTGSLDLTLVGDAAISSTIPS